MRRCPISRTGWGSSSGKPLAAEGEIAGLEHDSISGWSEIWLKASVQRDITSADQAFQSFPHPMLRQPAHADQFGMIK